MKRLAYLSLAVFLSGCTTNNAYNHFENKNEIINSGYGNSIKYTKKIDLLESENSKRGLYITYLNSFSEEFNVGENFLVGYFNLDENEGMEDFLISLENSTPQKIEVFDNEKYNKLFNNISLKNKWAKYYIVSFDKSDDLYSLELNVTDKISEQNYIMEFQKD